MASPGQPWQKISGFNPGQDQPQKARYFAIYLDKVALPGAE
jgi:hypothetical protein